MTDHYQRSSRNCFAAHPIDRLSIKRHDAQWLAERLNKSTSRILPMWRSKNLFTEEPIPQPVALTTGEIGDPAELSECVVLLGENERTTYFVMDLPTNGSNPPAELVRYGRFRDLRGVGPLLEPRQSSLLAYARAMTYWHQRHRFCGVCGSPTVCTEGGHVRMCSNQQCRQPHFPRTDPAIIVAVTVGEECLLARQAAWPKGMHSVIAGFVEPGESLEAAVMREVLEETGVQVAQVSYHSSQPWPFPGSIMLGFTAQGTGRKLQPRDNELAAMRWFTREQVIESLQQGTLALPTNISIAYRLIEDWFDAGQPGALERLTRAIGPTAFARPPRKPTD